jgi:hypothetical protein
MKLAIVPLFALCLGAAHAATPTESQTESCETIRTQIKAQTGVLTKPDTALLGKVGANKICRFTSAEAYRAAWGDKPMPKDDRRTKTREHDDR